jgi:hypothetical protein
VLYDTTRISLARGRPLSLRALVVLDLAGELMDPLFDVAELTWPGALPLGWYTEWEPAADPADRGE